MAKSKFGFAKVEEITAAVLRERIKYLEAAIDDGKWDRDPEKRFNAQKVAAYYRWQLKHDDRFQKKSKAKKKTSAKKAA